MCGKKVITSEIGQLISSAIFTLLAISFSYSFSYNPSIQQILEFMQEMVVGDSLPASRKVSTSYSNFCRAINCIKRKMAVEEPEVHVSEEEGMEDSDNTQEFCDFV